MNRTIKINSMLDIDAITAEIQGEWQENSIVYVNGGFAVVVKSDLFREPFLEIGKTYTMTRMELYYHNRDGMDGKDIWSFAEVEIEE